MTPRHSSRPVRSLALALAFAVVLVGCVQSPVKPASTGATAAGGDLLAKLEAAPAPDLDGAGVAKWLDAFVNAHHPRLTGSPDEKAAGDDLAAQLQKLGYEVQRLKYDAQGLPSADGPLQVVLAVKKGTTMADHLVIAGAHYDTAPVGTALLSPVPVGPPPLYATYDNGSGTAMVMELARLLAHASTTRTVEFAFFNGEEEGVLASTAYARDLAAKGAHVDAYLGFDMVGIGYPSKAGCLCIYAGKKFSADLNPVQETVAFGLLKLPRGNDTVQVFDNHDKRNSDEASFASAGFPTMRWAGLALAGDYWAYHKLNDTMDTMVQAGGPIPLALGMQTASETAYYTILALDAR